MSSQDQILAEDEQAFIVRATNVSVTITGELAYGRYVKKDSDLGLTVETYNKIWSPTAPAVCGYRIGAPCAM